ncbi:helix-turn-helix domain-containing protein [Aquabacterium sp.]|uniref:helix-turn-helix domain-containing protein n=1 Tax=Aquabacterium sp. TaxID=1872578 RepID=UPI0025C21086|nr:helix-turn-helix domain-containing protein [Aquabacterium sp.]
MARTLNLVDAAQLLQVHPKTLQKWARSGLVPACKVGKAWLFLEHLLIKHLVSESLARVSVADSLEKSKCRFTDAKTHLAGGSNSRPSRVNRDLYSRALGLPIDGKRSRSMTGSKPPDGSKNGSA